MIVDRVNHEVSPGVTAISLTGRLVLGNRLSDVEHAVRETGRNSSRFRIPARLERKVDMCDWSLAKVWLLRELRGGARDGA